MPRSLTEAKTELLRKLVRERELTIREIADRVGCGTGTVTRMKRELGIEVRKQTSSRVTNLLAQKPVEAKPLSPHAMPKNTSPSLAAIRLAAFDPIVRRGLVPQEPEDGE